MAHSSLKVQKLGAQGFSRPMMKVGQLTPSPRNRRTSSSSAGSCGGSSIMEETVSGLQGSNSKRGRFRGVLLTTPTKINAGVSTSSTPSSNDSMFQSSSRMILKSSPPSVSSPLSETMESKEFNHMSSSQLFKFALTIGDNGRASIAGSSPLTTPKKELRPILPEHAKVDSTSKKATEGQSRSGTTYEKKRVLSLLRQMRNGPSSSKHLKNFRRSEQVQSKKSQDTFKVMDLQRYDSSPVKMSKNAEKNNCQLSPSVYIPKSPQFPSTPRASFPMRTGLTPNVGIDQVLLDIVSSPRAGILTGNDGHIITLSPRGRSLSKSAGLNRTAQQQQFEQQQQQQQYVFKFSSADPLLMTDDVEGSWSEVIYNHVPSSPKHQICFNTPPSWMNLGSPKAFTPLRRDSNTILISACQSSGAEAISQVPIDMANLKNYSSNNQSISSSTRKGDNTKPSTPDVQQFTMPTMIECTPLIHQPMSGTLNSKCSSELTPVGSSNDARKHVPKPVTMAFEQEDAVVALKKLITER